MTQRLAVLFILSTNALSLAGCVPAPRDTTLESSLASHEHPALVLEPSDLGKLIQGPESEPFTLPSEHPFVRVGLLADAASLAHIEYRVRGDEGDWSEWSEVELTWAEAPHYVGRILLDRPANEIALRSRFPIDALSVELLTEASASETLTSELPFESDESVDTDADGVGTQGGGLAPSSLVISRAAWGARQPSKVCGSATTPYRATVHHTVSPATDGGDPAARLRQMQAYHIDVNGWCDIGYHFVVAQSGQVYQGRSSETRPGAHAVNQNAGNIGVSLIGNFTSSRPPAAQQDGTVRILRWLRETYDIPWNRNSVRGHREWPSQGTECPGREALAVMDSLLSRSSGASSSPPPSVPPPSPTAPEPPTSNPGAIPSVETYWRRNADGSYSFRALPSRSSQDIREVVYSVDGFEIGRATSQAGSNFPIEYAFTAQREERKLLVRALDASGRLVGEGRGLLDVTEGHSFVIRQLGDSLYEIGLEWPVGVASTPGLAFLQVFVDGFQLTDRDTGSTNVADLRLRYEFSHKGDRTFRVSTFNADGTLRGSLYRSYRLE